MRNVASAMQSCGVLGLLWRLCRKQIDRIGWVLPHSSRASIPYGARNPQQALMAEPCVFNFRISNSDSESLYEPLSKLLESLRALQLRQEVSSKLLPLGPNPTGRPTLDGGGRRQEPSFIGGLLSGFLGGFHGL